MQLCTNDDKKELMEFLIQKPTENSFFIGDIENYDLDDEFIDVWKFYRNNKISTILLRYYRYYLIATDTYHEKDMTEIANMIKTDKNCITVSSIEKTVDIIARYLDFIKINKTFLAELNHQSFHPLPMKYQPQKASAKDINDLFEFQQSIAEFSTQEEDRDNFGKEITANTGRIYYIKDNNKIVSSATMSAENSINGTIINVATDPKHRNKGYAQACVIQICKEMIDNGKSVVLFYNNPNAGKLYKKVGFIDVGKWSMGIIK